MKRNFGLDVVRAISIWAVLLQHFSVGIPGMEGFRIGVMGVEVFFVLSGFLIGGILLREIDKGNTMWVTLKSFWVRRWYRILPLYYATLAFKYFLIDDSIGANIWYYVFFLQNNFYGIQYLGVSWSLVIEEWFYIVSPIFLYLATKVLKTDKAVFWSIIAFIIGVIGLRIGYVMYSNVGLDGVRGSFPVRFDSLFVGVLLAFLKYKKWKLYDQMANRWVFFSGVGMFLAYCVWFYNQSVPVNLLPELKFPQTIGMFIVSFSIMLTVPYAATATIDIEKSWFNKSIWFAITQTSVFTYAIYLCHPFVNEFIHTDWMPFGGKLMADTVRLAGTYLVAWLLYRYFEHPILKFRDKITSR